MSNEQNKELAHRFYDAFNSGDINALDGIILETYIQHSPGIPQGREGVKGFMSMFRAGFPDAHLHIEDLVSEGDRIAGRWTAHGTHQGELMGIPPTGKEVHFGGIDIWRVENGMLAEHWDTWDQMGMMQRLGVIPA